MHIQSGYDVCDLAGARTKLLDRRQSWASGHSSRAIQGYNTFVEQVVHKFTDFRAADEADRRYYRSLTPAERVRIVITLMERSKMFYDDPPQGLERVCRITQLSRS